MFYDVSKLLTFYVYTYVGSNVKEHESTHIFIINSIMLLIQ